MSQRSSMRSSLRAMTQAGLIHHAFTMHHADMTSVVQSGTGGALGVGSAQVCPKRHSLSVPPAGTLLPSLTAHQWSTPSWSCARGQRCKIHAGQRSWTARLPTPGCTRAIRIGSGIVPLARSWAAVEVGRTPDKCKFGTSGNGCAAPPCFPRGQPVTGITRVRLANPSCVHIAVHRAWLGSVVCDSFCSAIEQWLCACLPMPTADVVNIYP